MNKCVKTLLIGGGITAISATAIVIGLVYGVALTASAYALEPEKVAKDLNEIGTKINTRAHGKQPEEDVCEEKPTVKIEITEA